MGNLGLFIGVAASASLWCNDASKSHMVYCISRSEDHLAVNMELTADGHLTEVQKDLLSDCYCGCYELLL